jgi:hypothetical protein
MAPEQKELNCYELGTSLAEAARLLSVSTSAICRIMKSLGKY